jgi:hypothetical protein
VRHPAPLPPGRRTRLLSAKVYSIQRKREVASSQADPLSPRREHHMNLGMSTRCQSVRVPLAISTMSSHQDGDGHGDT